MGVGALDHDVRIKHLLRADVDYARPPRGGEGIFDLAGDLSGKLVLDYGCGLGPYRDRIERRGGRWVGVDLAGPNCSVVCDGLQLPFRDASFGGVLCAAVLEHMPEPDRTMEEVRRVLVPGGKLFGYVAFLEPLHGMSYFHMSHLGLEYLLLKHGFRPEHIFAPHIGPAYLLECVLFPKRVPGLQPVVRRVSQWSCAGLLWMNRILREIMLHVQRRPEAGDPGERKRYRELLALRFAVGLNFVAVREDLPSEVVTGYGALIQ